jgi:hypothetical protein
MDWVTALVASKFDARKDGELAISDRLQLSNSLNIDYVMICNRSSGDPDFD